MPLLLIHQHDFLSVIIICNRSIYSALDALPENHYSPGMGVIFGSSMCGTKHLPLGLATGHKQTTQTHPATLQIHQLLSPLPFSRILSLCEIVPCDDAMTVICQEKCLQLCTCFSNAVRD